VPLPTEYWTRPIDSQLREWAPIAGNSLNIPDIPTSAFSPLGYNRLRPYNDAPETAHLLWQKVLDEGGLVGADLDYMGYEHGDAYSGKFQNPVIINGILFYNQYPTGFLADFSEQRVCAVDLHTGEKLWDKVLGHTTTTGERLSCGQVMYWQTMDMYGAFAYLWTVVGTTWNAYAPLTGRWEYTMTNVPSGFIKTGPNGEILIYTVNLAGGWMTCWNSTNVVDLYGWTDLLFPGLGFLYAAWYPWGKTVNATGPCAVTSKRPLGRNGYMWNKTIPTGLPGGVQLVLEDRIIGGNTNSILGGPQPNPVFWGINITRGSEGDLLFNKTWTLPVADTHVDIPNSGPASLEDGVFVVGVKELRQYYGLSLDTGTQLWGPTTPAEPYLNAFTLLYEPPWGASVVAYGKLFTAGMAGVVNAYDVKTGKHLWTYEIKDPYTETLWGNWPAPIGFITDGKIYLFHMEHSGNTPLPRGAPAVCLNATTGDEIWRINGLRMGTRWGGQPIIGDSIIAGLSSYDNTIVTLGKGPSATTVSIQNDVITKGSSVLIKGTVMDVSPGTSDPAIKLRFPDGVPAIADKSMSDWMLYVYKQFPRPADLTGVPVTLDAVDPTGEWIHIDTVTSDSSGSFSYMWTPPAEGLYQIVATCMGTKSYYASYAQTALGVVAAPPAPEPVEIPPYPEYTPLFTGLGIAVVVVAILVIYTLFTVRKLRK